MTILESDLVHVAGRRKRKHQKQVHSDDDVKRLLIQYFLGQLGSTILYFFGVFATLFYCPYSPS